jgi:glycosyltransferase involved in cell wall biosynthesis
MSKFNMAFLNTNKAWGGGEKWHLEAALYLKSRGWNVHIITHSQSELKLKALSKNISVVEIDVNNLSFINPYHLLKLYMFIKNNHISGLITNLPSDMKFGGIAGKLAGIKKLIYRRGMPHPLKNNILNKFLFKFCYSNIIGNSQEICNSLIKFNSWFPQNKVSLVYNGIKIHKRPAKHKNQKCIIGNVARLVEQKGQHYLIELGIELQKLNFNFEIQIAGSGPMQAELETMIVKHQLSHHVKLLGHLDNVSEFMNQIDVLAFTSLFEGSANVLVEALGQEIPVVAFNTSSNPEVIIHNTNGFLVDDFNMKKFAEYVIQLFNNDDLRNKFQEEMYKSLNEKFNAEKNFKKFEDILLKKN